MVVLQFGDGGFGELGEVLTDDPAVFGGCGGEVGPVSFDLLFVVVDKVGLSLGLFVVVVVCWDDADAVASSIFSVGCLVFVLTSGHCLAHHHPSNLPKPQLIKHVSSVYNLPNLPNINL